jgi:signal transduction histidine kinase
MTRLPAGRTVVRGGEVSRRVQAEARLRASQTRLWTVDAAVAVAVGSAQVGLAYGQVAHRGGVVTAGDAVLLVAGGLVLVARRRFPAAVMVIAYVIAMSFQATQHFGGNGGSAWLSVIVAFATAIYLHRRAAAIVFLVVCYVVSLWGPVLVGERHAPSAVFALSLGAGLGVLLGGSELIRLRRQRSVALTQRRQEEELRRVSEERLRIARELHDVVAHNISVINVQANTALHLMDRQPERARLALTTINDVSKHALVELRSILGILRGVDEQAPRTPTPSLARFDELIRSARASGLGVRVEEQGESRLLPTDVDVAAFRIVQEALTNSTRHSGGQSAVVRIAYGERDLVIEVDDDGSGGAQATSNGSGNGITGMAERARALGGTLQAGSRPGGGFRVRAYLPFDGHAS